MPPTTSLSELTSIPAKVSLDRISDFLLNAELLDSFEELKNNPKIILPHTDEDEDPRIGFKNATFAWSQEHDGTLTPSGRYYQLHIEDELLFKQGKINLIIGPTYVLN